MVAEIIILTDRSPKIIVRSTVGHFFSLIKLWFVLRPFNVCILSVLI